jgi:arylsulfatase A-like enzyme
MIKVAHDSTNPLFVSNFWMIVCVCFLGVVSNDCGARAADTSRPNVVFILADDLGWGELGCFGQKRIPTPNLDRLATQGMRLTRHYSGAPVCAPSRCVLMTGKHLGHAEIRGNQQAKVRFKEFQEGQHPLSQDAITIPKLFARAGYETAAMGKWGLGPVGSTGDPNKQGIGLFFGYNCQAVAHSYYPEFLWRNSERIRINPTPVNGHQKVAGPPVLNESYQGQKYAPDLMIEEAVSFVKKPHEVPFFLFLAMIEPHVAMHPPEDRIAAFPKDWDDEQYMGDSGYLPNARPRAAYAAMIHELDSYVGQVLEALDKAGLADNTLVVFSSDNGTTHAGKAGTKWHVGGVDPDFFHSTAGLRGFKGSLYEGGIRVPTIARWPGKIPAASESDFPSYFADWLPTLVSLTGIPNEDSPNPTRMDGLSIAPTLLGGQQRERDTPMLWVFPEYGGQVAVRIGDFKVLRQGLKTKQPGPWQVFNIVVDPNETTDLALESGSLIARAESILREEISPNEVFPLDLPDR